MKLTCTLILFVSLISTNLFAQQIPNNSFEDWSGNNMTGWVSTNGLTALGNPQTVFKSNDAHSGSFACEINTFKITNKPPVYVPTYAGSIFVGKQILLSSFPGFPFTERPTEFRFWYKYNARNQDTANTLILTTRWNTLANKRDTLSRTFQIMTDSVGVYTEMVVKLNVFDTLTNPDTAIIFYSSASNFASKEGAKLLIDELRFAGGTVGIKEALGTTDFSMYPNPLRNESLKINVNSNEAQLELSNLSGEVVYKNPALTQGKVELELNLAKGLYLVKVSDQRGVLVKKLLIE
ncbi:MAG: hypothetical protein CFE21_03755 [Bacteroidetes bacterium B1(2017)]|nr:MAG: hypothetical protein CFE21_03755 [Bacteroidetes bacterium B1(2017)]